MLVRIGEVDNSIYKVCNRCLDTISMMHINPSYFAQSGNIDFMFDNEAISISPHIHVCKKCLDIDAVNDEKGWERIRKMITLSRAD